MQPEHPITTTIPHFDAVLGGGIPQGSVVLIIGIPGAGKTTLASQIIFDAVRAGKRALIMASFSESTATLIAHLRTYDFFDPDALGGPIQVLSLRQLLAADLSTTQAEVMKIARQHRADIILLDSVHSIHDIVGSAQSVRQFFYDLGTQLSTLGITTLITSEANPRDTHYFAEMTTADLVIGLHYDLHGVRQTRGMEVVKLRGAHPLPGLHAFTLSAAGGSIYPQLEERVSADLLGGDAQTQGAQGSVIGASVTGERLPQRYRFDVTALDALLSGGIPQGTSTVVAGSIGVGKTLLAVHFALAGVRAGERVAFLSFRETPEQLARMLAPFTLAEEWRAATENGTLTVIALPAIKINPDIVGDRLLGALDETGAQRLIIDSVAELEEAVKASQAPERLRSYLAALMAALQMRGVTTLFVKETPRALAPTLDFSAEPLAVLAENVLLAQSEAMSGAQQRSLSVLKLRYSSYDAGQHTFTIGAPEGIKMGGKTDAPEVARDGKSS